MATTPHSATPKADHVLTAETGVFALTGGTSRATFGAPYTGRNVEVGSEYALARAWFESCSVSARNHVQFEAMFATELETAVPVSCAQPLFRGRRLPSPPSPSTEFGPNPKAARGRYNWEGNCALYLCDSVDGVIRELEHHEPLLELWIQEFSLPRNLKLLDARAYSCASFTAAAFSLVEQQRDRDRGHSALGARIADLVKVNFDGMIVPGVRAADVLYSNVIVFEPKACWRTFVTTSAAPRRATESSSS